MLHVLVTTTNRTIRLKENQMSKKLLSLAMAMAFTVSVAGVSMAAKKVKCEILAIDDHTYTLKCSKKSKKLKVGDVVEMKGKKKAAVEGC